MPTPAPSQEQFARFYSRHYKKVMAYCGRRLASSDVLDAVSDVFLVAWRRFDDVPEGGRELAWLYGVASRTVANHRRSALRRTRLQGRLGTVPTSVVESPVNQLVRHEADREVMDAIARLRRVDREVVLLHLWEGLDTAEVGSVLGINPAAVRKRLSRARRRLEGELASNSRQAAMPVQESQGGA